MHSRHYLCQGGFGNEPSNFRCLVNTDSPRVQTQYVTPSRPDKERFSGRDEHTQRSGLFDDVERIQSGWQMHPDIDSIRPAPSVAAQWGKGRVQFMRGDASAFGVGAGIHRE